MMQMIRAATAMMMGTMAWPLSAQDVPLLVVASECTAEASAAADANSDFDFDDGARYAMATAMAASANSFAFAETIAQLSEETYVHESESSLNSMGETVTPPPDYPATGASHPIQPNARVTNTTQFGYGPPPPGLVGVMANATVTISSSVAASVGGTGLSVARVVGRFEADDLFFIQLTNPFSGPRSIVGWYFQEGVGMTQVDTNATGISFVATRLIGWGGQIAFGNYVGLGNGYSRAGGGGPGNAQHTGAETGSIAIQGYKVF